MAAVDRARVSVSPFGYPQVSRGQQSIAAAMDLTMSDDEDEVNIEHSLFAHICTPAKFPNAQAFIDLTSDSEDNEDVQTLTSVIQNVSGPSRVADIDKMEHGQFAQSSRSILRVMKRQASGQPAPTRHFLEATIGGILYRAGMSLELKDGSFLRIEQVDPMPFDVRFTGRHLFRATHPHVKMYLPKQENELIWVTQKMDSVGSKHVKKICDIRFTNHRTDFDEPTAELTCRLKLTIRQQGVVIIPDQHPLTTDQTAIEYLNFRESDAGFGKTSIQLRDEWRGQGRTTFFGEGQASADEMHNDRDVIDLTGTVTGKAQAYTFGDAYCGGGGMSCGARQAGLDIRWAVDNSDHAVDTYQRNFDGVEIEHADFFSFLTNDPNWTRVDICHCSPPCQTFSPAHTVQCAKDDANSACIFSAGSLCRSAKPRVLTMEETAGLPERWAEIFHRVLLDLVEIGYSLRWSVLRCDDYGVPQERKRLVVIAAGPGETLPHFPQPTHGLISAPGLLPRTTIWSAIADIPDDTRNHDVEKALHRWRLAHRAPFDGHRPAKTITCGGGEYNYHPTGLRPFTDREMACLQTFPMEFEFSDSNVRKQIGNAVPPFLAKAVYTEVAQSLRESDAKEASGVWH
ncbi:hypothetical protein PENANT_c008G05254 [Penicillium antarcticum]|uniref:DNA (cytosine-5-)-methyltransferase n=1 Tax=Penicillium antarcticum TaxID=416450 RepID=A0A1V6QBQ3_9EURO|nr:uncharacterized protein N7508_007231 [Penicillium antarcticum]KAJ5302368.1 hypothetical protein N7508_007231 [Penicillium antarcticum]OQD86286.1 hypothetical protein PENANT_c008G05254 [Penicillium antarcticum]